MIILRRADGQPVQLPRPILIEEVTDPEENAQSRKMFEQFRRNSDWLQAHGPELLPAARGKFLVVAGEEAFLGDTPAEAWSKASAAHPEDQGSFMEYVRPERGPRVYAHPR